MITVIGLAQLKANIAQIKGSVPQAVREAVDEVADSILESAREKVHVSSGDLRAALDKEVYKSDDTRYMLNVGPRDGLRTSKMGIPYSVFQEFGTSRHPANPYLRPAFDENKERGARRIGEAIIKSALK